MAQDPLSCRDWLRPMQNSSFLPDLISITITLSPYISTPPLLSNSISVDRYHSPSPSPSHNLLNSSDPRLISPYPLSSSTRIFYPSPSLSPSYRISVAISISSVRRTGLGNREKSLFRSCLPRGRIRGTSFY